MSFNIIKLKIIYINTKRAPRKSDLVMPDQGRALAHELGIYYYETSVFTYYGVNEVFENAIRAALIARRQQRFWMTNLKRVQRPLLQVNEIDHSLSLYRSSSFIRLFIVHPFIFH